MSKLMLMVGASVLTIASGSAAMAQTTQVYGGGGSLIAPTLRTLEDCYGQKTDLLTKNSSGSPSTRTMPDFVYTGVPAYDCSVSTVDAATQLNYNSTGSGTGVAALYSHDASKYGDINAATAGDQFWSAVHYGTSDSGLGATEVGIYNNGGTQNGAVVVAPGATPGVGQYANPREKFGPMVQFPMIVAPVAIAFDPVYKKVRQADSSVKEYKIFIKKHKTVTNLGATVDVGGLLLDQAAYCAIFNGTLTNLNDARLTALNGASLRDPADPTPAASFSVPLQIVGRSDSSGTTSIFYRHLAAVCGTPVSASGTNNYEPAGATTVPAALQGPTYDKSLANTPVASEALGKYTRAAGNDGIAKYLDFTALPGATAGDTVTQARIGYLGPDYALPYAINTGANAYGLFIAQLKNANGKYEIPSAATAAKSFGTLVPPQSTATGVYDATAAGSRSNPADWVQSIASSSPLASIPAAATTGYPIIGTTNYIGYQCYATAPVKTSLVGFLTWFETAKTPTDNKVGAVALAGFSPMPKPWIAAIKDTFLTDKYHLGLTINTAGAAGTCGVATIVGG